MIKMGLYQKGSPAPNRYQQGQRAQTREHCSACAGLCSTITNSSASSLDSIPWQGHVTKRTLRKRFHSEVKTRELCSACSGFCYTKQTAPRPACRVLLWQGHVKTRTLHKRVSQPQTGTSKASEVKTCEFCSACSVFCSTTQTSLHPACRVLLWQGHVKDRKLQVKLRHGLLRDPLRSLYPANLTIISVCPHALVFVQILF